MADSGTLCRRCGALSTDPQFCSACGAELQADDRSEWLQPGDILRVRLLPTLGDLPEDALPVSPDTATAPMPGLAGWLGDDTVVDDAPFPLLPIRLDAILHDLPRRRVLSATSIDGRAWRIEQFPDARDDEDTTSAALPHYVDMPVAFTVHKGRAVRVHRVVPCTPLPQRIADTPLLSPRAIHELLAPALATLEIIHAAEFLCLRLAPWSIAYRPDGSVYLLSVPGLYPRNRRSRVFGAVTHYSAPDVYLASDECPPDERADIFSLGAILYFLLARRDPPTDERTAFLPCTPARSFALTQSIDLDALARHALHPRPARRPDCVAAFRRALERAVERATLRSTAPPSLCATVAAETHPGVLKRTQNPVNQDGVFAAATPDGRLALLAVADGVSTASVGSGDIASRLAIDAVRGAWERLDAPVDDPHAWLRALVDAANDAIITCINDEFASADAAWHDVMGTTLVVALVQDGHATLASVGDSRATLIGPDYAVQLTRDHNLGTLAILDGVPPSVALAQASATALGRCLGNFERASDGRLLSVHPEADLQSFRLLDGERLLLATDGLHDYAAAEPHDGLDRIADVCRTHTHPAIAANELIALANRGGGGDNIGVALLAATPEPASLDRWVREHRRDDVAD